eukprot:scaffold6426_cov84-Cylindrotheca_fusiformis.AAC.1
MKDAGAKAEELQDQIGTKIEEAGVEDGKKKTDDAVEQVKEFASGEKLQELANSEEAQKQMDMLKSKFG